MTVHPKLYIQNCTHMLLSCREDHLTLLVNLEKLLGLKFPSPSKTSEEVRGVRACGQWCCSEDAITLQVAVSLECGICYMCRLDGGEAPEVTCNNPPCSRTFHHACLFEVRWRRRRSGCGVWTIGSSLVNHTHARTHVCTYTHT